MVNNFYSHLQMLPHPSLIHQDPAHKIKPSYSTKAAAPSTPPSQSHLYVSHKPFLPIPPPMQIEPGSKKADKHPSESNQSTARCIPLPIATRYHPDHYLLSSHGFKLLEHSEVGIHPSLNTVLGAGFFAAVEGAGGDFSGDAFLPADVC